MLRGLFISPKRRATRRQFAGYAMLERVAS